MKSRRDKIEEVKRIYRDSSRFSATLLKALMADDNPYRAPLSMLGCAEAINITCSEEAQEWVDKAEVLAADICTKIPPYLGLPTLLQAFNDCYYEESMRHHLLWIAHPLKVALAYVSGNVFERRNIVVKPSLSFGRHLREAVLAVALLDQLRALQVMFEVFGQEGDFIEFGVNGPFQYSSHMEGLNKQYSEAFIKKGGTHRTLDDAVKVIWNQMNIAWKTIENVIEGQPPQDQPIFTGTVFSAIPANVDRNFWGSILNRLKLALFAAKFRNPYRDMLNGITVIEPGKSPEAEVAGLTYEITGLFWDSEWYKSKIKEAPGNMLVERPLVRLNPDSNLYATSFLVGADSLNWFLEASILPYLNEGGIKLPEEVFKRAISTPFENAVIELFRKKGFLAGQVKDKSNSWNTQKGTIILKNNDGKIPGEIDCLAYHHERNVTFVAECKVLGYPHSKNRTRNLMLTLGETDAQGFYGKLRDKVAWVGNTDYFLRLDKGSVTGVLVLDRKVPGMLADGDIISVDVEILEAKLANLVGA